MVYKELILYIDESFRDEFIAELLALNFDSFSETDNALHAFMPSNRWSDSLVLDIRKRLQEHREAGRIGSFQLSLKNISPQNWQEQWERTITPIYAGKRIVIHPSWQTVETTPDIIEVIIDPKMSFGTGHHETTQMMIELLEEYCSAGTDVLDIGTGSGILAIIAARLAASRIAAIDNDYEAIINARENSVFNNITDKIDFYLGRPDETREILNQTYDLILANLERKTILELFDFMTDRLNTNGILLLSGLIDGDLPPLNSAWKMKNLTLIKTIQRTSNTSDTWIALALKK
jgi:ribosomal protein L11 methyltransferase